jgi:hypothetical protein
MLASVPRNVRLFIPVAAAAALLAFAGGAAAGSPAHLAGAWAGTYSGAFSGSFTLHWTQTGAKLGGSIVLSSPHGRYGITGSVSGTTIRFDAVGAGATYTGSVSGTSMSGHWKSPQGGGSWNAHKTS